MNSGSASEQILYVVVFSLEKKRIEKRDIWIVAIFVLWKIERMIKKRTFHKLFYINNSNKLIDD